MTAPPDVTGASERDPLERDGERAARPGARGQPHATIARAGHFLQEDAGEEIAERVARWARG